ncbi:filamentous hemagglutinin N-terminal domain-containing protein [Oscillatoria sp. FACHB-1407]|uniref:two-partner secretion domain-containing protein n=1 Tax=Oscillatoria sp. FACHB-1407 TaxID=2692847 RepID=UPI0016836C58|nr:filamentous hemagglutinin N-terminal domain-containing protein [Oscillatoria sp. FACHB-1407]MBD2463036.1 filamentous hemagglutinin N-terminal domain-containing protein [Oscillatoria sp. FACHB-1407]
MRSSPLFTPLLIGLGIVVLAPSHAFAQSRIIPDNTLGAEQSRVTSLDTFGLPVDGIDQGAVRGRNLFHSFQEFSVSEGREAYFLNPSNNIQNILARVTGNTRSEILGTLSILNDTGVTSNPNLFLINPNGILFGPNASIAIGGSFVTSTANVLQFSDQGFFSATNPEAPSPLLTVNPSAFLFNQINPGNIDSNFARLQVPDRQNLTFAGGNINISGGLLNAPGGRIDVGATVSTGVISLNADGSLSLPDEVGRGNVLFNNGAIVNTSSDNGGNITILARNITLSNGSGLLTSILLDSGTADSQAGNLILNATGDIQLLQASLLANAVGFATGNSGNINIRARFLSLRDGSRIVSSTLGQGNAGNIVIEVSDRVSLDGVNPNGQASTAIGSVVSQMGKGKGGDVQIITGSLSLTNGAQISTGTFGQGNAGNIFMDARDRIFLDGASPNGEFLTGIGSNVEQFGRGEGGDIRLSAGSLSLTNGAYISASTSGEGNAGNILIDARDRISLDGVSPNGESYTFISSDVNQLARGQGGNVRITTGSLSLTNGAQISADTSSEGNAGNVSIDAHDRISLDGVSPNGESYTFISSDVNQHGRGQGGNVRITTGSLFLANGARISASTFGQGNAGDAFINARDYISLDGASPNGEFLTGIGSAVEQSGRGQGGDIRLSAGSLALTNSAYISASTSGEGNAGNILIDARDRISLDGANPDGQSVTGITSRTNQRGIGQGGNIRIITGSLFLSNGAQISADTLGISNAGNIFIDARDHISLDGVTSNRESPTFIGSAVEQSGRGQGGNVRITTGSLALINGAQISAGTFGQGNAGNVFIDARDHISLDGANPNGQFPTLIGSAVEQGGIGQGGDVSITTSSLFLSNGAEISASTFGQGDVGNVFINARDRISLDGASSDGRFLTMIAGRVGQFGRGRGRDVRITTDSLFLTNGAQISASTSGQGDAGNVFINARDRISINGVSPNRHSLTAITSNVEPHGRGQGGGVRIATGSLSLTNGALILASTFGEGNAGNVFINARNRINVSGTNAQNRLPSGLFVATAGKGQAGVITLNTNSFRISNGAVISAQTINAFRGGNIIVNANTLEATNGGRIITTTTNQGQAGNITLNIRDTLLLSGSDPTSGLFANTVRNSRGQGGTIRINTDQFRVEDGARVEVNSLGSGAAGDVLIRAGSVRLANQGRLIAETQTVDGGNIVLTNLDQLLLREQSSISTNAGTTGAGGDGGNIGIDADFIVAVPTENSDITANAARGNGGRVDITTQGLFGITPRAFVTPLSDITASSEQGVQGVVAVNTPNIDPRQGLLELPTDVTDATQQIAQNCPTGGSTASELGEFVVTGRGGLPPSPTEVLGGETVLTQLASTDVINRVSNSQLGTDAINRVSNPQNSQSSAEIVEAQGWVVNAEGAVMLIAQESNQSERSPLSTHCSS